uniref:Abi family protein n=1 Tax=Caulobacter sp. (strain K31) TaxID=366602 RepID=B0T905_CAUSK
MALLPYQKPHARPDQWVTHLVGRGLIVPDPALAAAEIERVGYERLRIYFRSRRDHAQLGKPFRANTTYRDILRIYECDQHLRSLIFEACGAFELAFRNTIGEVLSQAHGSHPHRDLAAFASPEARREALDLLAALYKKSKDARAKHYMTTYSSPVLPPIWTMKEFLTFGAAAKLHQMLSNRVRGDIALKFGVRKEEVFTNWVLCLVDLRNVCAHHDRLFNRAFQKQPRRLTSAGVPAAQHPQRLKAILECLDYLLASRGSPVDVVAKARALIVRYPEIALNEAGW